MPHQCTTCGHTFPDGSKEMLSGCPDCGGNTFQFHPPGSDVPDQPPDEDVDPPEPEGGAAANRVGRAATKVRDFVGGSDGDADADTAPDSTSGPSPDPGTDTADRRGSAASSGDSGPPDPEAPWPDDASDGEGTGPLGSAAGPDPDDSEIIDADARREANEDLAQTSARGEIASPDEVADGSQPPTDAEGANPPASGGSLASSSSDAPPDADGRVVSEPTGEQPDIEELREQLNDQFESIKIVEPGEYELNLMELYNREEYIIALQENGRYVIQVPENWLGDRPEQS